MFEIGDRVKCIKVGVLSEQSENSKPPPLILHREYIIYGIHECSCGRVSLDVGITTDTGTQCTCLNVTQDNIWWCSQQRFIKVKEKKEYITVTSNIEIDETIPN